jgi:hypothetical protein
VISKTFPSGSRKIRPGGRVASHDLGERLCTLLNQLLACPLDVLDSEADLDAPPIVLR